MKKITTLKDIEEKNREKNKIIYQPLNPNPSPVRLFDDLQDTIGKTDAMLNRIDKKLSKKPKWYHRIIAYLTLIAIATGLIWVIKFFILKII